jgi:hypothetical protein
MPAWEVGSRLYVCVGGCMQGRTSAAPSCMRSDGGTLARASRLTHGLRGSFLAYCAQPREELSESDFPAAAAPPTRAAPDDNDGVDGSGDDPAAGPADGPAAPPVPVRVRSPSHLHHPCVAHMCIWHLSVPVPVRVPVPVSVPVPVPVPGSMCLQLAWRNVFTTVNFLRILQKLVKRKPARIRSLLDFRAQVRTRSAVTAALCVCMCVCTCACTAALCMVSAVCDVCE